MESFLYYDLRVYITVPFHNVYRDREEMKKITLRNVKGITLKSASRIVEEYRQANPNLSVFALITASL